MPTADEAFDFFTHDFEPEPEEPKAEEEEESPKPEAEEKEEGEEAGPSEEGAEEEVSDHVTDNVCRVLVKCLALKMIYW